MTQRLSGFNAAFPVVPFSMCFSPQLSVGLLKSILVHEGATVHDLYLNLELATRFGLQTYDAIANSGRILLPERLFSSYVFKNEDNFNTTEKQNITITQIIKQKGIDNYSIWMRTTHAAISDWIHLCIEHIDWANYNALFFSCSFSQLFPALSLAKGIKNKFPSLPIIFGGSEIFQTLAEELSNKVNYVDVWAIGEGDEIIIDIAEKILKKEPVPKFIFGDVCKDLTSLPTPDFTGYFEMSSALRKSNKTKETISTRLPIEMSRGCWWAEKQQCTFCSIVGKHKQYRPKDPVKIIDEISQHASKYESFAFQASDCILAMNAFDTLLPSMKSFHGTIDLFIQVKSNLNLQNLLDLKNVGVSAVQPGIESLNTSILKLMGKGCNAGTNVHFLKNTLLAGLRCYWNILLGFPGETEDDYQSMINLMPKLFHLEPPYWAGFIRLEKGSPLWKTIRNNRETKGFYTDMRPMEEYKFCYPSEFDIDKLARFYSASTHSKVRPETYTRVLHTAQCWSEAWKGEITDRPSLSYRKVNNLLIIYDNRGKKPFSIRLEGPAYKIAELLENNILTIESLRSLINIDEEGPKNALTQLLHLGFIIDLDQQLIWLPLPEKRQSWLTLERGE